MSRNDYATAERINTDVNAGTRYQADDVQYGRPEYWIDAGLFGDCEDYALKKMSLLGAAGWPQDKMGLCLCRMADGVGHCVLFVDTEAGGFILDNNHGWPMRPDSLPYVWESMLCDGKWRAILGWQ